MIDRCDNPTAEWDTGGAWLAAFDYVLNLIATALEHLVGLLGGAVAGLLAGRLLGGVYANHIEPLHFQDLDKLAEWSLIPHAFARNGAVLGAIVGLLAITALRRRLSRQDAPTQIGTGVEEQQEMYRATGAEEEEIPEIAQELNQKRKGQQR